VPRKQASHPEELELIQRLRKGDQRARTALVRRYHSGLLRQAFLVLRDEALAQDVVQDAWLGAFKSINRFDGRSSLLTWLIRIVVNKARSRRSREFRSVPFSALVPTTSRPGAEPADHPMDPEMPVEALTPEWLLLEREAVKTFEGALRALPASQRSVVVLRDLEGASSAETCRALQINDLTQRVRLSRARATLRLALQGSGPRLVA
jgi:RNA polymerase sigma-70 factor (ECF subfamily)